uniref:Uncharacterized protein n=1 Tax=Trichogramma kaykai TaxID=54128 RepID=A0ABD2WF45_9HYME
MRDKMTSLLPNDDASAASRFKQKPRALLKKSLSQRCAKSEESRSFLDFSRENLNISTSELEQGFNGNSGNNKHNNGSCSTSSSSSGSSGRSSLGFYCCWHRRACRAQTFLCCLALILALGCMALQVWKMRQVADNFKALEAMRSDVETLKHRLLEKDLLDELRAFEEQLYSEGTNDDESPTNDYDSSYEDQEEEFSPSPSLSVTPVSVETRAASTAPTDSNTVANSIPCTSRELEDVLRLLRHAETERASVTDRLEKSRTA